MKVTLKPETIEKLEGITETKITRNGDQVIQKVAELAENVQQKGPIEMSVCNNTKQEISEND